MLLYEFYANKAIFYYNIKFRPFLLRFFLVVRGVVNKNTTVGMCRPLHAINIHSKYNEQSE